MRLEYGETQLAEAVAMALVFGSLAWGQNVDANGRTSLTRREVVVSIPDRKLAVLDNGTVLRIFPVAVGARNSPSPAGEFQIVRRLTNPTYYHPGAVIPPGKDNPLGPRWLGLNQRGFGIHGTNAPTSVGKAASHGCIRLRNRDVVELYSMVRAGDMVKIRAERDAEIARIFGTGSNPRSLVAQVSRDEVANRAGQ
jgi:hypothetical protein